MPPRDNFDQDDTFDEPDEFDQTDDRYDDVDDFGDADRDDRFRHAADDGLQDYRPPGMSGCAKFAIGCGIIMFVLLIAVGIGVWWISQNALEFGADLGGTLMKEGLKELRLPEDQKQRIFDRIDEVSQRVKDGETSVEEVGVLFKKIAESPLMPAGLALVVERVYLDESGFDEEEKAAAGIAIQRFTHGAISKAIPEATVNKVLDTVSTSDELRAFVAAAIKAADEAEVPKDVPKVNFADEFDKVIDEALGVRQESAATEPPE